MWSNSSRPEQDRSIVTYRNKQGKLYGQVPAESAYYSEIHPIKIRKASFFEKFALKIKFLLKNTYIFGKNVV